MNIIMFIFLINPDPEVRKKNKKLPTQELNVCYIV